MPHIVEDRVLEQTASTGTGNIVLGAAITGFRRFSAVCAVGDTAPYFIEAIDAVGLPTGDYEYGVGTYTAANTLARTKVLGSSNANALVNFAAGSKNVGIPALASSLVPTGMLADFMGTSPPAGWLERNGALVSRLQYPALWAHAQASGVMAVNDAAWVAGDKGKFSPGDGATTFRLPDHRAYFMRAWDHGAGLDAGRAIGSVQADALQGHWHGPVYNASGGAGSINSINSTVQNVGGAGSATALVGSGVKDPTQDSINGAPRVASETRPSNIAVLACIKT